MGVALAPLSCYLQVVMCKEKTTGHILAVKILKKDVVVAKNDITHTLTEKIVLRTLQIKTHPFLLVCYPCCLIRPFLSVSLCVQNLKYSFQTSDRLCLVTEYVRGGNLLFHLQREEIFTEGRTRFYGAEIILGVQHLHQLGVIHRNISVSCVFPLSFKLHNFVPLYNSWKT